jgi:hypothetical protein
MTRAGGTLFSDLQMSGGHHRTNIISKVTRLGRYAPAWGNTVQATRNLQAREVDFYKLP